MTVLTQSSTISNSVLVPFAGAGILTPAQIYPVTVGANLGTTFTVVFAAFAVSGPGRKVAGTHTRRPDTHLATASGGRT